MTSKIRTETKNHFIIRVAAASCPSVDVLGEGYSKRTWRTRDEKQSWWITWDDVPAELNIAPENNHSNGLLVVADCSGRVEISADRFGTIPAFYRRNQDGLVISNDFDAVASGAGFEPDEIGFWELVLFETPLADRTLLKDVKFLSPGTTLIFMPGGELRTRRYWNFTFKTLDVKTDEECAVLCGEVLSEALRPQALTPTILPIGGGVDCRLLAAALHKVAPQAHVSGVTYGYDQRILEYVYAKKVFQRLGWPKPLFHKLTSDSYIRCMEPQIRRTGGLIGVQNCHFFDFLCSQDANEFPILSGMYSDAVCGWDASLALTGVDKMTAFEHVALLWSRAAALELPDRIVEGVCSDLQAIRADWKKGSSITSFNEYMYVRERNAKFHLLMADSWRMFAPVKLPFAEPNVAMTFLSLPTRFREHKRCTFLATRFLAPELDGLKNVSSAFRKVGLGSRRLDWERLWVSRTNRWLERSFGPGFQLIDRAETERHSFNLKYHHAKVCEDAYAKLMDYGLCDQTTVTRLETRRTHDLPIFSHYQILSNMQALRYYAR